MQHQDSGPSGDASPPVAQHGALAAERPGLDAWLRPRLDLIALLVVAVGFVVRLVTAAVGYLNPDEALHYLLANQPSVIVAYKASLTNAHPPLFFLLLYFWRLAGNSELALRLPSLLAGTAMLWVAFRWLGRAFGATIALIGLIVLAFSPVMKSLSAEVRGYAVLLLFMASALYWLERAFEERSASMMARFSLALYLAILTHYAALWFTLALGVYALLRIIGRQLPASVVKVWGGFQVGAVALYVFLFITHISSLKGGTLEQEATSGWLRESYFQSGQDSLLLFPLTRSAAVFGFVFSQRAAGIALFLAFLGGVVLMLVKGVPLRSLRSKRPDLGILLLLPFFFGCGAAILGIYPYGDTRHSVYLALFAVAGVSVLLGELAGRRVWPVLLAAGIVVPIWTLKLSTAPGQHIQTQNQRRVLMARAVNYIRQTIPQGALLFVDYHTSVMLGYYLGKDQIVRFDEPQPQKDFLEFPYGGYRVVSTKNVFIFEDVERFGAELKQMKEAYGVKPGELIWVVQSGWGVNIYAKLTWRFPELYFPGVMFGGNLSVFQVPDGFGRVTEHRSSRLEEDEPRLRAAGKDRNRGVKLARLPIGRVASSPSRGITPLAEDGP